MQHAVEGNIPFAHIDVIPVVKDAFKPPTGAVMNADHILFHAILKAGLTSKIRHHQLYARKNIIEPKICMAIFHRICGMADKWRRPWCYDFIFQIVQLLHRVSPHSHFAAGRILFFSQKITVRNVPSSPCGTDQKQPC